MLRDENGHGEPELLADAMDEIFAEMEEAAEIESRASAEFFDALEFPTDDYNGLEN